MSPMHVTRMQESPCSYVNFQGQNIFNNLAFSPNFLIQQNILRLFLITYPENIYILKADFHVDNCLPLVSLNSLTPSELVVKSSRSELYWLWFCRGLRRHDRRKDNLFLCGFMRTLLQIISWPFLSSLFGIYYSNFRRKAQAIISWPGFVVVEGS